MGEYLEYDEIIAIMSRGDESDGVVAVLTDTGWMPLIATDPERRADIRRMAFESLADSGQQIFERHFVRSPLPDEPMTEEWRDAPTT